MMSDISRHIVLFGILVGISTLPQYVESGYRPLTILHTNDIHARFDEVGPFGGPCTEELQSEDNCFGGIARRISAVNTVRAEEDYVILLDAGDTLQGSLWYEVYQGSLTARFMNMMSYDAMAIGRHEFDLGVEKLTEFVENLTFPALACNINGSTEPDFAATIGCSQALMVHGEIYGVVGFTDERYVNSSQTGELTIGSIVQSLQSEVDRLMEEENVTRFIAVGHTSLDKAKMVAREVRGLDVIIVRSSLLLFTGESPDDVVEPADEYPIAIRPDYDPERTVLLVTTYPFGKYIGRLNITFDDNDDILSYNGNPILLDSSIDKDPQTLQELETFRGPVDALAEKKTGFSLVPLDGSIESCGRGECNLGNTAVDAFFDYFLSNDSFPYWGDINFAVTNAGAVRGVLQRGDLTFGDIFNFLPHGDFIHVIEMKGEYVLEMLEHSVARLEPGGYRFELLQSTGLRLTYDISKRPGSRIVSVLTLCTRCEVPRFVPIIETEVYKFATNSFLSTGGDGYSVIPDKLISRTKGPGDKEVLSRYLSKFSPLWTGEEGRITFTQPIGACANRRPNSILEKLCQLF